MADETYRQEIVIDIRDNSGPGMAAADRRVSTFERRLQSLRNQAQQVSRSPIRFVVMAVDQASRVLGNVATQATRLTRSAIQVPVRVLDLATAPIRGIMSALTSLQGLIAVGIGGYGAKQALGGIIDASSFKENTLIGLEVMLKSKAAAEDTYRAARRYADLTPWVTRDVVATTGSLVSARFGTGEIFAGGLLNDISDLAAANQDVGADLSQIASVFGRLKAGSYGEAMERLRGLKIGSQDLRDAGLEFSDSNAYQGTPEEMVAGVRQVIQNRFGGLTEKMQTSWQGIWSTFTSQLTNVFEAIGAAPVEERFFKRNPTGALVSLDTTRQVSLFDVFKERVKGLTDLLIDKNGQLKGNVVDFGRTVASLFGKLNSLAGNVLILAQRGFEKLDKVTSSEKFKNADLWGKATILWDEFIGKPFEEWWGSGGEATVRGWAERIGGTLGSGIGGIVSGVLDLAPKAASPYQAYGRRQQAFFDVEETLRLPPIEEKESIFVTAGRLAGGAFFESFTAAFDVGQLADKVWKGFVGAQPIVGQGGWEVAAAEGALAWWLLGRPFPRPGTGTGGPAPLPSPSPSPGPAGGSGVPPVAAGMSRLGWWGALASALGVGVYGANKWAEQELADPATWEHEDSQRVAEIYRAHPAFRERPEVRVDMELNIYKQKLDRAEQEEIIVATTDRVGVELRQAFANMP